MNYCSEIGIRYLTLYTFSKENWNRPAFEVDMLMRFLEKYLKLEAENLTERNIRFKAIGDIEDLPGSVARVVNEVEASTAENDGMLLQLALSYSGRDELVSACRKLAREVAEGSKTPEEIDEASINDSLQTSGVPDPDLLIRTSGELRISNFLLWQLAYTELYVTDVLWPDFTTEDLLAAIRDYTGRERRFGLTGKQLIGMVG